MLNKCEKCGKNRCAKLLNEFIESELSVTKTALVLGQAQTLKVKSFLIAVTDNRLRVEFTEDQRWRVQGEADALMCGLLDILQNV